MSKYYFKIDQHYADKNQLDKEFAVFMIGHDSTLLQDLKSKNHFIEMLKLELESLQEKHSRCKKIPLDIWSHSGEDQISLRSSSVSATIYRVKYEIKISK